MSGEGREKKEKRRGQREKMKEKEGRKKRKKEKQQTLRILGKTARPFSSVVTYARASNSDSVA
jgi:hypothetical protein